MKEIKRELIEGSLLRKIVQLVPADGDSNSQAFPYTEADTSKTETFDLSDRSSQHGISLRELKVSGREIDEEPTMVVQSRSVVMEEAVSTIKNIAKINPPVIGNVFLRPFAYIYRSLGGKHYHPKHTVRTHEELLRLTLGEIGRIDADTRASGADFVITGSEAARAFHLCESMEDVHIKDAVTDIASMMGELVCVGAVEGLLVFFSSLLEPEEIVVGRRSEGSGPGVTLMYKPETFRYDADKLVYNFSTKVVGDAGRLMYRYLKVKMKIKNEKDKQRINR